MEVPEKGWKRAPRWMKILMIGSIAVNFLIAGFVVGAILRGPPQKFPRDGGFSDTEMLHQMVRVLPDERKQQFRKEVRTSFTEMRRVLRSKPDEREALRAALQANPVDLATLDRVFNAQHERFVKGHKVGQDSLIEQLGAMSEEERRAFADTFLEATHGLTRFKGSKSSPRFRDGEAPARD